MQPLNVLEWKAPPLLIEWACRRMRKDETPRPIERWWQLAALAVAQRSEDGQFLVGDTSIGLGVGAGEILNPQLEIKHLEHVRKRFPEEMRFMLAEGIARDRFWQDDAMQAYGALSNDPVVGGEAMMRMGVMLVRMGRREDALKHFDRAESLTRDRYVIYLVKYFRGRIAESQRQQRRGAGGVPRAPRPRGPVHNRPRWRWRRCCSRTGVAPKRRSWRRRCSRRIRGPSIPWREYVHADNRFWPLLIGKLRTEILK